MKNVLIIFLLTSIVSFQSYSQLSKGFEAVYLNAYQDVQNQDYFEVLKKLENIESERKDLTPDEKFYILVLYYAAYTGLEENSNLIKTYQKLKLLVENEKFKKVDKSTVKQVLSQYELALANLKLLDEVQSTSSTIYKSDSDSKSVQTSGDKVVSLTVSGQGKTIDEAKNNAFRTALELAFGTFISSRTEILNDELLKDEIVSISNGNIQKFDIISQTQLPNGTYSISLNVIVSVTKLTSFVENKGFEVEFKGGLFAENIKIQKLNEEAEYKAISNLFKISDEILSNSLTFEVYKVSEPILANIKGTISDDLYHLSIGVKVTPNNNFDAFEKYFSETIKSIGMKENEIQDYRKINKKLFALVEGDFRNLIYFRNEETAGLIQSFFIKSNKYLHAFKLNFENFVSYNVEFCCLEKSNVVFGYEDIWNRWKLNNQEQYYDSNPGFPNFFFIDEWSREMSSWTFYMKYLKGFKMEGDYSKYFKFLDDLYYFDKNVVYKGVDPNPYLLPPYEYIFLLSDYQGNKAMDKSIIGGFNFVKFPYLHEINILLDLNQLEKIKSISVEPKF